MKSLFGSHKGMMILCVLIMGAAFLVLIVGHPGSSGFGALLVLLLLASCLGMHFLMHKFIGKSCHGDKQDKPSGVSNSSPSTDPTALKQVMRSKAPVPEAGHG